MRCANADHRVLKTAQHDYGHVFFRKRGYAELICFLMLTQIGPTMRMYLISRLERTHWNKNVLMS